MIVCPPGHNRCRVCVPQCLSTLLPDIPSVLYSKFECYCCKKKGGLSFIVKMQAMGLAAAPNGKTGRQEDMFSPQKNAGDGRLKDGSTKSQKFGCFICRGKHVQRLCPQLKLGKSIRCWKCGDHRHLSRECPRPRRKRWKRKGRLSIGWFGGKQGS